jgi:Trk-type K+ transport system membrane component
MGKIVIMITMYLGRVGPISLALALGRRKKVQDIVLDPVEDISIG